MAEMDTSGGGGHKKGPGVKKGKKLSTRVDMTPMVDLGFLLITFFVFTTTMAKPKTMEINMPYQDEKEPPPDSKVKSSTAMTILLSKNHRVYYYEGIGDDPTKPPELKSTTFKDAKGIRAALIEKKKAVEQLKSSGALLSTDNMTVLIKPDINSSYSDLVNILDEMTINDVPTYAVVDITPQDKEFITMTEAANPADK